MTKTKQRLSGFYETVKAFAEIMPFGHQVSEFAG